MLFAVKEMLTLVDVNQLSEKSERLEFSSVSRSVWLRCFQKVLICLRDYNWQKFSGDLFAGVTVGLVALPLAMAFAISSGVPPQAGIYTAIVAGFLISALGGQRHRLADRPALSS